MRTWWRSVTGKPASIIDLVDEVRRAERGYAALDDEQLKDAANNAATLPQVVAVTPLLASRGADGAIANHSVQPGDRLIRRGPLSRKLHERLLNDVLRRCTELPRKQHQRRSMAVEQLA